MPGVSDLGNNSIKVGELFGAIGAGQVPSTGYQTSIPGVGDYLGPFLTSGFNIIRNMNAAGTPSYVIGSLGVNDNIYLTGNIGVTGATGSMTYDALYRFESEMGFHTWCTPVANAYAFLNNGDTGNVFALPSVTQEYMHAWQYIINRYGGYCDVWELGNEMSPVTAYMATMASWVKQQDPYKHLTAISFAGAAPVANLDLQSNHNYTSYSVNPTLGLAGAVSGDISTQHRNLESAPIIFGEAGQGGAVSDPPANEDFRQWENVSFFNQAFESPWPNNICNGYNGGNTECMDTEQLAQMAVFSTFAGSVDPAASALSIALTGGANGQTLKGWALGSPADLAGYILNTTNRTVVHNATVTLTVPGAGMKGEWIAPSTGTILSTFTTSGTAGSQTLTIPDFSSTAQTGDIWFRIRSTPSPVVMTFAAPGCLINTSCPLSLSAIGGAGGYTWAITGGALPPGLTMSSSGAITGTPTQAGNWIFSVVATDSSSVASTAQKLILVVFPAIAVGNTKMDNFTVGFAANAYHLPIVITGGMPPVTCVVSGATPPGLSFNGFCGASGTATTPGTYTFAVTATDSLGNTASAVVSATVNVTTVGIEESNNPDATVNWPFNWTGIGARESGGLCSCAWSVTSGSLPAGLLLSSSGSYGTISGKPTVTGSTTFQLTATDNTSRQSSPVSYTLTVNSAPFLTTSSLPSYTIGSPYYTPVGVSNGTPPTWCAVAGALPPGFILDPASCELYGTTSVAGSFPVTLTAYDSNGYNVSSLYTLSSTSGTMTQAVTFGALSDVSFGVAPFAITATASSGLAVTFTSTTSAVCTVSNTTVSIVGGGTCSITASQAGNASYSAATPVTQSFNIFPPGTTSTANFSEFGVFRSSASGFWLDLNQSTYNYAPTAAQFTSFGLPGDQPVAGDWTGSGVIRIGIFRQGNWYIDLNNNGVWDGVAGGDAIYSFGLPGDIAIPGDWGGTGVTKLGVMRCPVAPAFGGCTWYLDAGNKKAWDPATAEVYSYGLSGDLPVVNNWNGTGKADQIGVFRQGNWIVENVGDGVYRPSDPVYQYGLPGDIPVVGNWSIGPQRKRIGVYRNGTWFLDTLGTNAYSPADVTAAFGLPGDQPIVGFWTVP